MGKYRKAVGRFSGGFGKMKFYYIIGNGDFSFNGYQNIILKVTKETKDKIEGETFIYNHGNFGFQACNEHYRKTSKKFREKITIIKSNVQGWKEIK